MEESNGFEEYFVQMAERSGEGVQAGEDDYYVDGLLYCGKCHHPKQTRVTLNGREYTPFCICKCRQTVIRIQEEEAAERQRASRIEARRRNCFSDGRMMRWTFDKDDGEDEKLLKTAKNYVDSFKQFYADGVGLLFFGNVGAGKSFAAACIANGIIDKGYSAKVISFPDIKRMPLDERDEYLQDLPRYSLLIIDDFAVEKLTEYTQEMIYQVIDGRLDSGKPLVVTTNLTAEQMRAPEDRERERIYSRILEKCVPVQVAGKDRRREHGKQAFNKYKKLLEI